MDPLTALFQHALHASSPAVNETWEMIKYLIGGAASDLMLVLLPLALFVMTAIGVLRTPVPDGRAPADVHPERTVSADEGDAPRGL